MLLGKVFFLKNDCEFVKRFEAVKICCLNVEEMINGSKDEIYVSFSFLDIIKIYFKKQLEHRGPYLGQISTKDPLIAHNEISSSFDTIYYTWNGLYILV